MNNPSTLRNDPNPFPDKIQEEMAACLLTRDEVLEEAVGLVEPEYFDNGYLQDMLFKAKIHPRRRVVQITEAEKQALYQSIRDTLQKASELGGRDTEHDFYDQPGK